jgi:hypothetical protein
VANVGDRIRQSWCAVRSRTPFPRPIPQSQTAEASRRSAALFRQSVLETVSISVNGASLRIEICNEIQSLGLKKTQTGVRFNGWNDRGNWG